MKRLLKILFLMAVAFFVWGCEDSSNQQGGQADFKAGNKGELLTVVAGSENKELEPLIKEFADKNNIQVQIDYLGSLDIMRLLQSGEISYDAVWPASTIWLSLGDKHHLLKHIETTSISPVVFGIRQSLAEELGFIDKDVYVDDIMQAINSGKLKFAMTSATQSNSGASAYIGFLTALADNPDGLSHEDLTKPELKEAITSLLAGVNRGSGSSNWLVDLFLSGDYDAMVNYETLIIQTNNQLIDQGKEPLHLVYPVDGLSLSDSPLAYVDHEEDKKEEAFLELQNFLLSEEAQLRIQDTGKRSVFGSVDPSKEKIFKPEWGIDLSAVLAPIRWPQSEVIIEALNLYQAEFKKPGMTFYVLDYSGSMSGTGHDQMIEALEQVLVPENAAMNLLLPTTNDLTYIIPFASYVEPSYQATGNGEELEALYTSAAKLNPSGGTALYEGVISALDMIDTEYRDEIHNYSPAIVLLTDGRANGEKGYSDLQARYQEIGLDIPIFSIMFADADDHELSQIAELSRARVFDGRKNLIDAFQTVKGYN